MSHDHAVPEPCGPQRAGLRRRDFLVAGSFLAAVPFLGRAAVAANLSERAGSQPAGSLPTAAAAAATLPVSMGYLDGSQEIHNLRRLSADLRVLTVIRRGNTFSAGRRVVPATDLSSGDPSLVGGAVRMTVHGLYPPWPDDLSAMPRAIDLDVFFPSLELPKGHTAHYKAWSYRRLPAENHSARVSFLLWPDWYSDLEVSLRVLPADPAAPPLLLRSAFTLGADPGRPRLARGAYLLGLAPDSWEAPVDLPEDPAKLEPKLFSILITFEPEGVSSGGRR
ncbi:MAG TPA: hypothetical protein VHQ90_25335 [Thermoanaerobaculia bacterium]|nr:hypothetical protein [Thermoanaerobaculia bacterium]